MSPRAITPLIEKVSPVLLEEFTLDKFSVTSNGFLPSQAPLRSLTDSYYEPWETLIRTVPGSLKQRTLRFQVDQLPVLSLDRLATKAEWRRAYVILSFLTHAYIWGGDRAAEVLPPSISIPLLQVSSRLELPPVATYAGLNLWNFTSRTTDFTDLDSIHALHTFTGTEDESWFYMVSVAMEAQGAYIIPIMMRALESVRTRDYATITHALREMSCCIRKLGLLLDRMDEKCDPTIFYHQIRPFLAGSKNMASAGLPRGVFYPDDVDGRGRWLQLRGGSNGQSSLIQFFDIVLGVEHTSRGGPDAPAPTKPPPPGKASSEPPSFHEEVRAYMPGPHRRFLEHATAAAGAGRTDDGGGGRGIRDLVSRLPATETATAEQMALRAAFQEATGALGEFRGRHLQIVARYIVIPSRQQQEKQRRAADGGGGSEVVVNLANVAPGERSANAKAAAGLTGTGGTELLPFLKQARDETYRAGFLEPGA